MDKNLNVAEPNFTVIKCLRQHIGGVKTLGEHNSNNEPIAPLPYLLLKNPDDLCYLNCILNILNKSKSIQKMFFDWTTTDDSIRYRLAKIIQGDDRSAKKLRKMLSEEKFHTGPQDVTHVLPCLLKDLRIDFTQEEVTFCDACNNIRTADSLAECSVCENHLLTKGTLITHHETCFAITGDQFTVLHPNEHFTVNSVNYRLNAFAQYTESMDSEVDYGHYVAWIRRLETNENAEETENTRKSNNEEEDERDQYGPGIQSESTVEVVVSNNYNEGEQYPVIQEEDHNEEIERIVNNEVEYSPYRDFVCVDDDQLSSDEHFPLKDMIINWISLEKCSEQIR